MGGGERGEVSCAELDVGGAARVQLEGGLGKQLGEGACIALAKRSCLFGCLAMGRGEAILTTGGAPSGALAYGATVTDATRFCLAPGTTGVFGLRGMISLCSVRGSVFEASGRYETSHGRKTRNVTALRLFVRGYNTRTTEKRTKRPKTQCGATPHCLEGCVWAAGAAFTLHLPRHCPQSQPSARRVRGAVSVRQGSHPRPADPLPEQ